jgi:hypothetical protein
LLQINGLTFEYNEPIVCIWLSTLFPIILKDYPSWSNNFQYFKILIDNCNQITHDIKGFFTLNEYGNLQHSHLCLFLSNHWIFLYFKSKSFNCLTHKKVDGFFLLYQSVMQRIFLYFSVCTSMNITELIIVARFTCIIFTRHTHRRNAALYIYRWSVAYCKQDLALSFTDITYGQPCTIMLCMKLM